MCCRGCVCLWVLVYCVVMCRCSRSRFRVCSVPFFIFVCVVCVPWFVVVFAFRMCICLCVYLCCVLCLFAVFVCGVVVFVSVFDVICCCVVVCV